MKRITMLQYYSVTGYNSSLVFVYVNKFAAIHKIQRHLLSGMHPTAFTTGPLLRAGSIVPRARYSTVA